MTTRWKLLRQRSRWCLPGGSDLRRTTRELSRRPGAHKSSRGFYRVPLVTDRQRGIDRHETSPRGFSCLPRSALLIEKSEQIWNFKFGPQSALDSAPIPEPESRKKAHWGRTSQSQRRPFWPTRIRSIRSSHRRFAIAEGIIQTAKLLLRKPSKLPNA